MKQELINLKKIALSLIFAVCITNWAFAQSPNNDDCFFATSLPVYGTTCGGATLGILDGATQSLPSITCNNFTSSFAKDVWYSFVATSTDHDITVSGSSNLDAVVELISGGCNNSITVDCADATLDGETEVIAATGLTVGNTYYVRVYGFGTTTSFGLTFTICVTTPTPPAPINNFCINATSLPVYGTTCGGSTLGTVTDATESLPSITCNNFTSSFAGDVWYSFVATSTNHDITVSGSSNLDAVVELISGGCNNIISVDCADATVNGDTEIITATGLTVGSTYYVRVYDFGTTTSLGATFTICVTTPTPPSPINDFCINATNLPVYGTVCGGSTIGNVTGATESLPAISCNGFTSTFAGDVWYSFVAVSSNQTITVSGSTSMDPVIELISGGCNMVTTVDCADATFDAGTEVINATGLTVGSTYHIRVYDFEGVTDLGATFSICVTTPVAPTPSNNMCINATSLTVYGTSCGGSTTGTVAGATQSLPAISCNGFTSTIAADVWYSFVATSTEHDITVSGTLTMDAVVELISGGCNNATNVDCADATFDAGTEVINATGLTIGSTYYVRVYDFEGATSLGATFTICVTTPVPPAPNNDLCFGATSLPVYGTSCGGSTTGTVNGATQSLPAISCNNFTSAVAADVWYSFVATSTEHNITVSGSSSMDAVIELFSGGCNNGNTIDCADATVNGQSEVIVATGLNVGSIYYVRVYDFGSTTSLSATFTICVTTPAPPAPNNDVCLGATSLPVYGTTCGGTTLGTVNGATQSLPAISCNNFTSAIAADVWYSFVATSTGHTITVSGSSAMDAVIELISGGCNNANTIDCADATFDGGTEIINATGLTVGNTYYVRVYHYGSTLSLSATFTICITTPCVAPNTTISASASTICIGNSATLTASGANSYSWSPSIGLNTTTGAVVMANPITTTTYTVTGTTNGCSNTQAITVEVNDPAVAFITQSDSLLTANLGNSYQWFLDGIAIQGATLQTHLATQNGSYTVMVINAEGCFAVSDSVSIGSILGIDKLNGGYEVIIYPNPFSTSATIKITGMTPTNGDVTMVVMDVLGKELKTESLLYNTTSQNTVEFTINRNDLANGMYFYKLVNRKDIIAAGKFTVQ